MISTIPLIGYVTIIGYVFFNLMLSHEEGKHIIRKGSIKKYTKDLSILGIIMWIFNPISLIITLCCYHNVESWKNKEPIIYKIKRSFCKILKHKPFK